MRPRAFQLRGGRGVEATLLDVGATLMALRVPDRRGVSGHVVLGFDEPEDYLGPHPHLGCVVGRFANRIAHARFRLGDREVQLVANDGVHHLHGGSRGFGRRRWEAEALREAGVEGVRFQRASPDGEEGYPGTLRVTVEYRLAPEAELRIDYRAETDRTTIVGLSQHAYFNLCDGGASDVLGHELWLRAGRYTPVDAAGIPTGEIAPVGGTPLDFTRPRTLGAAIDALRDGRGGYDHNLVIDGIPGRLREAGHLHDPTSGRVLQVETTLPALQLYTGNHLDGSCRGRGGQPYRRHAGVCLEAQGFPDAPHHPGFPSAILEPGQLWVHTTVYRFGTDRSPGADRGTPPLAGETSRRHSKRRGREHR